MPRKVKVEEVKRYIELNGYREQEVDYPPYRVFFKTVGRPDEPILVRTDPEGMVDGADWERIKATIIRLLDETEN